MTAEPHTRHYMKLDIELIGDPGMIYALRCSHCGEPLRGKYATGSFESCDKPGEALHRQLCLACFKKLSEILK